MAVPTISPITSIQEGLQWQPFELWPYATNTPTSWACLNLPTGITINETTGKISGVPETFGTYILALTATNGEGTSAVVVIPLGIAAATRTLTSSGAELQMNLYNRTVSVTGLTVEGDAPLLYVKFGDRFLVYLQVTKGDTVLDLALTSVTFGVRARYGEPLLVLSSDLHKYGSGNGTYYALAVDFSDPKLAAELSNYETDNDQSFLGLAEIEIVETNSDENVGEETNIITSRNFRVAIIKDLVENA